MTTELLIKFADDIEPYAVRKYPVRGRCGSRDYHRLGMIPVASMLDGGLPGDSCQGYCLDCGKKLSKTVFLVKKQPNSLETTGRRSPQNPCQAQGRS